MVKHEGGDEKIPQGIGEEIMRHPSSVWFCDINTGLGEIIVEGGDGLTYGFPWFFFGLVYPMISHIYSWNMA